MDPISYPGPYCEALAITEDALLGADELPVLSQVKDLTKGVVYKTRKSSVKTHPALLYGS